MAKISAAQVAEILGIAPTVVRLLRDEAVELPTFPSLTEASEQWRDAIASTDDEALAFAASMRMCSTVGDVDDVTNCVDSESIFEMFGRVEKDRLLINHIQTVTTTEEAEYCYRNSPDYSESERLAFAEWVNLCTTPEEVAAAFDRAHTIEQKKCALDKLTTLLEQKE